MQEVVPGIWHWSTFHQPIRAPVSSYYVQSAAIVVDPKVPEEGFESLPERPQQVVLTSGHHDRDAARFAEHFGIPIRASRQAIDYLAGQLDAQPFEDGDEVAPGVTSIHIGKLADDEGALHIQVDKGAIALADAVHRYGGALGFFADELLGDDPQRIKEGLKDSFRGLLSREFDHLLFAHGEPLIGGGKTALRRFVESRVGQEDFGQSL